MALFFCDDFEWVYSWQSVTQPLTFITLLSAASSAIAAVITVAGKLDSDTVSKRSSVFIVPLGSVLRTPTTTSFADFLPMENPHQVTKPGRSRCESTIRLESNLSTTGHPFESTIVSLSLRYIRSPPTGREVSIFSMSACGTCLVLSASCFIRALRFIAEPLAMRSSFASDITVSL